MYDSLPSFTFPHPLTILHRIIASGYAVIPTFNTPQSTSHR
jgi:hypothetical protein